MNRFSFNSDDLTLSGLDDGRRGAPLLCLHAHWVEAASFNGMASALGRGRRVIAPDQRGHGESQHAQDYSREAYLKDLDALFDHLKLDGPIPVFGNSLGGVNAYQYAARRPERVSALIIEDIGAVVDGDLDFVRDWKGSWPSRDALIAEMDPTWAPYAAPFIRYRDGGWGVPFDIDGVIESQKHLNGDHWGDWMASDCPALVIRSESSRVSDEAHLKEMAEQRPNTEYVSLPGRHQLHVDSPEVVAEVVKDFFDRHSL